MRNPISVLLLYDSTLLSNRRWSQHRHRTVLLLYDSTLLSNLVDGDGAFRISFTSIRFYITLKRLVSMTSHKFRFTSIRFYITLKQVLVPVYCLHGFTSIRFYITLKLIFHFCFMYILFYFYTILHYSQTDVLADYVQC